MEWLNSWMSLPLISHTRLLRNHWITYICLQLHNNLACETCLSNKILRAAYSCTWHAYCWCTHHLVQEHGWGTYGTFHKVYPNSTIPSVLGMGVSQWNLGFYMEIKMAPFPLCWPYITKLFLQGFPGEMNHINRSMVTLLSLWFESHLATYFSCLAGVEWILIKFRCP